MEQDGEKRKMSHVHCVPLCRVNQAVGGGDERVRFSIHLQKQIPLPLPTPDSALCEPITWSAEEQT